MIVAIAVLATLFQSVPGSDVEYAAETFWARLAAGDRVNALELVHSEDRNTFLSRPPSPISDWKILSIDRDSEAHATVRIEATRLVGGRPFSWKGVQNWVIEGDEWRVRMDNQGASLKSLWQAPDTPPKVGVLKVVPSELKVHLLSQTQEVSLWVHNGLDESVDVQTLGLSASLFEIRDSHLRVGAHEKARIRIRYIGGDSEKQQQTQVSVRIAGDNIRRELEIPVLYNYVSRGTRALFGLTQDEVEALRQGASLSISEAGPSSQGTVSSKGHAKKPDNQ